MTTGASSIHSCHEPRDRESAIAAAVEALRAGELVVLPTETVYGLFARADARTATDRLRALVPPAAKTPWSAAWHAPSAEAVLDRVPLRHALHRWLVRRLSPGPVAFVLPPEDRPSGEEQHLELASDPGAEFTVRIPSDPVAAAVLEAVASPVIGVRLGAVAGLDDQRFSAEQAQAATGAQAVLDAGPTRHNAASTVIRLVDPAFSPAGYEVLREGVYSESSLARRVPRRILFVCTGNTCRSPLAQAIARELVAEGPIPTIVESAGVAAASGSPATPDAVEAGEDLGLDLSGHHAQQVDRAMVRAADAIFAMTRSHAAALLQLVPDAPVQTLDRTGGDVPDPIGQGLDVYRATADRLRTLIAERLRELDA